MRSLLRTSEVGLASLKKLEGLRLEAYRCPAGVRTIGYGHTGPDVHEGLVLTKAEAEGLLRADLDRFEMAVHRLVTRPLTQHQFDAIVCLAFNIGKGGLEASSVIRRLNAGDVAGAADAFRLWNKVRGEGGRLVVSPGLAARREVERALFLAPTFEPEDPARLHELDALHEAGVFASSRRKDPPMLIPDEKPWYSSRSVWGGVVAAVCGLLPLLGVGVDPATQGAIADVVVQATGVVGAVAAVVFRLRATKRVGP